ncbi:putative deoxyribonuclease tatdn3 isoform X2 [Anarrhichthys ocellatus]|uniref:putative deoxyribonuclease tatdn3 isoform X2 n=1 Tax=Anarrhichthys ocellatus TaxID=433405 RepID=UPI0012EE654A|nr:putative deoxyribonuclease tatdn3 isoform X2 [Anarrhichthys ocellatus]
MSVPQDLEVALPQFYKLRERLVAIGEVGLDFTPWCAPTQQDRDDQMCVFIKQLHVAKELDLPVNVHSRSAAKVTIQTMREHGISRALLHNFAGKPSAALEGVKAGYLFSFPPAVCRNQQDAVSMATGNPKKKKQQRVPKIFHVHPTDEGLCREFQTHAEVLPLFVQQLELLRFSKLLLSHRFALFKVTEKSSRVSFCVLVIQSNRRFKSKSINTAIQFFYVK